MVSAENATPEKGTESSAGLAVMGGYTELVGALAYVDSELGRLDGYEQVFSTGNVVTGKGNIIASRRHAMAVTSHVLDRYRPTASRPSAEPVPDPDPQDVTV